LVFKDRAACCFRGFVLPSFYFSAAPHSTSGLHSLFRSGFSVKRPLSLRFTVSPRRESTSRRCALFLLFEEGCGTYFLSASAVNQLRRLFSSRLLGLVAFATSAVLQGLRLLPPPRRESTSLVDFVFLLSVSSGASHRRCGFASRPRGAASIASPQWSQPPSSTLFPSAPAPSPSRLPPGQGARLLPPPRRESTPYCRLLIPSFIPIRCLRRHCGFAFPFEGARLLPPPRRESTDFFDSIFPATRPGARGARLLRRRARLLPPPH
jgi:hypothetical protein